MAQLYMNDGTVTPQVHTETWDSFTSVGIDFRRSDISMFTVSLTAAEAMRLGEKLVRHSQQIMDELDDKLYQQRRTTV
jgi:hypothetical protein